MSRVPVSVVGVNVRSSDGDSGTWQPLKMSEMSKTMVRIMASGRVVLGERLGSGDGEREA